MTGRDAQLATINKASRMLAKADVGEALDIADKAEVIRAYLKRSGANLEIQNQAAQLRHDADRHAARLLAKVIRPKGGKPSHGTTVLKDYGIDDRKEYERMRLKASIPARAYAAFCAETMAKGEELTQVRLIQLAKRLASPPEVEGDIPLPEGTFATIVIDPPWPMKKIERELYPEQGTSPGYPTMTLEDIAELPVADKAAEDCHLYLWVTQKYLPDGLRLCSLWGFRYQCLLTWVKPSGFTPFSWMYNTEHVIFGRRGSLDVQQKGIKLAFDAKVTGHSEKPDVFYDIVSRASPGPRLELFARKDREGFTVWGDEVQ